MPPAKPETITATKTAVFQLRAPSAWKRAAILDALKRTHLATQAVLKALLANIDQVQTLAKKTERTALMQSLAYKTLKGWDLSGAARAAARVDALGMAESYLQQLRDGRETTGLPIVPELEGRSVRYAEALAELRERHATVEEESQLRDELNRLAKTTGPRPLSLHGYRHFYQLLRHPETDRLFAWVNLLSSESRYAASRAEANRRAKAFPERLVEIETGEAVLCKRPTWVLFPLEFGFGFHERRFLLAGKPAGGRLVYRPEENRFELHAGFEFETPAVETGRRFLGVDRGIYNLAAWAVTDADGSLLAEGAVSGMGLRFVQRRLEQQRREDQRRRGHVRGSTRQAQADEAVHVATNELVKAAKEHQARVVLEELTIQRRTRALPKGRKGGRFGRAARRILGRQQYAKLVKALTYKLRVAGLPPPVEIGAAFTSQTCPECGHRDPANRPKEKLPGSDLVIMDRFRCTRCGHAADADRNAARVIALKGAWFTQLPTKTERGGRPLREDEKFDQYLLDAIERRGSGGVQPVPS